ncbi:hypothetical protein JCM19232_2224 [Vibrio ishigakensis]|uniref:Aminoglycoside phosphotransferase domain-containing protein n=1 Tax=Vibrio ishigakensis TaxID=1481914 RepID=A0A0B8PMA5_9VIBR|nr:hypothetical protein JCM19232_2224 [Vibrio ishigakensis]
MDRINKQIQEASHSGALLTLEHRCGRFVVTKRIYAGIERAISSVEKQKLFRETTTSAYTLCSIPVLEDLKQDDYFEFTMPFIDGIGGDVITYKGNKVVADNLRVTLNSYLLDILSSGEEKAIPGKTFIDKVIDIKSKYQGDSHIVFDAIEKVIELSDYELIFPMGSCHGDLTLSNVKVTPDNKLYLFDFLDGFLETPLQDIVKLKQDFDYGWSFRKENKNLALKGKMFCEIAYPNMIRTISRLYKKEVEILDLVNLLRIAPYINPKDNITKLWLDKALSKSINSK